MARKESPETKLVKAMLRRLEKRDDVFAWRNNTGATKIGDRFTRFGVKGGSDILVIVGPYGRFCAVEVKVGRGKATEDQQEFIDKVVAQGGVGGVAYSFEDMEKLIEEAKEEAPALF